jgi:hypothetical protein
MPDALIAFLAMQLMSGDHEVGSGIHGREAQFWVEKAGKAFSTSLCQPEKGDPGEVFCALYLLLCGDSLRAFSRGISNVMLDSKLSVPFYDWWHLLNQGGEREVASKPQSKRPRTKEMELSTIQVWRDYLRDSTAYFDEVYLKYLYDSATSVYSYPGCKAFDILMPIRLKSSEHTNKFRYHPMLVSVKNWSGCTLFDVKGWMEKLKKFILQFRASKDDKATGAFCLVVLVGCDLPKEPLDGGGRSAISKETYHEYCRLSVDDFPDNDVYRILAIPEKDAFGIRVAAKEFALSGESSEVYASHAAIPSRKYSDKVLRSNSKMVEPTKALFGALTEGIVAEDSVTGK